MSLPMRPPRSGATPSRRRVRSDTMGGATGYAKKSQHSYNLFSVKKLLSVSTLPRDAYNSTIDSGNPTPLQTPEALPTLPRTPLAAPGDATIDVVAFGGYQGHAYTALSCSTSYIIVRHVGTSNVPLVRMVPWLKEAGKRILSMAFNPEATWLLLVTVDTSIYLIPVHSLMCHQLNERNDPFYSHSVELSSWTPHIPSLMGFASSKRPTDYFGPLTDVTEISVLAAQEGPRLNVTHCLWWKPWDGPDCGM
eukprot:TRINITY_DN766_c0_g1_i4.p1 TRINITY_DN766_c0_g1~~TRINITY_DN766_c0_g1_i4.p1  ORF type:complete len:250 (+),score=20.26 TRINITY_DN766_c0_g1_i4:788-1537(+)